MNDYMKNIQLLSEIGQDIIFRLSVESIIESTCDKVNKLIDASTFVIGLYNAEEESIEFPK
jgi:hypothetical protein